MLQYREIPSENRLLVYKPRCPFCKQDMVTDELHGIASKNNITGADRNVLAPGYFSMSPDVTWTDRVFRCKKHPQMFSRFSPELLDKINSYPHNRVQIVSYGNHKDN